MLYCLLNQDAKRWWYHKELRAKGNVAEARQCERASIRAKVDTLRQALANGGFLSIGRGGWTLHYSATARLSGYECHRFYEIARLMLPTIDTRTITDDNLHTLVRLPIPVSLDTPLTNGFPKGSSLSLEHWTTWAPKAARLGAILTNIDEE